MATVSEVLGATSEPLGTGIRTAVPERKFRPVVGFAVLGAAWSALMVWVWTYWIAEGKATPNRFGTDQVPHYMKVFANVVQPILVVATIWTIWHFLIRPWRRESRLTFDGMIVIAMVLVSFQDPLSNYLRSAYFTYNTYWWNFGSWTSNVPGWISPRGHLLPEAVFSWTIPSYVFIIFGGSVIACDLMRRAKRRWPQIGTAGLIGMCFLGLALFDAVMEPIFMLGGTWAFPGAIKGLTLYYGHYFQFPIYESIFWGSVWTSFTCLRYFKNDKGQTLVERGVDRLGGSQRRKALVTVLAVIGFTQTAYFLVYNVPQALTTMHNQPVPADLAKRPYLLNGLCGEGTGYSCGGPATPIPHQNSAHIGDDGRLVVPDAGRLHDEAPR